MLDKMNPTTLRTSNGADYRGPERRSVMPLAARLLALVLDEIDYGTLLVGEGGEVLHANHAARAELDAGHPLQINGHRLRAREGNDVARLHEALAGALQRGLRRLLALGSGERRTSVAVVPLGGGTALLLLGKQRLSQRLSVQCFASLHGMTPAETRVLESLCDGLGPREIAQHGEVGLATVRTQIGAIRGKTGARHLRALVRQLAVLPPMVSTLRC